EVRWHVRGTPSTRGSAAFVSCRGPYARERRRCDRGSTTLRSRRLQLTGIITGKKECRAHESVCFRRSCRVNCDSERGRQKRANDSRSVGARTGCVQPAKILRPAARG